MRGSRARIVCLHDGRDHGDALDGAVSQHVHVIRVQAADGNHRNRDRAAHIVQHGDRRNLGGNVGSRRVNGAGAEVIRAVVVRGNGCLDRLGGRADDLIRAKQPAADRHRQVARADMYAGCIAGNGNIHAVVDDERHAVAVGDGLDLLRQLKVAASAGVLLAELNKRCTAPARLVHRAEQGFGRVVGTVRNDI